MQAWQEHWEGFNQSLRQRVVGRRAERARLERNGQPAAAGSLAQRERASAGTRRAVGSRRRGHAGGGRAVGSRSARGSTRRPGRGIGRTRRHAAGGTHARARTRRGRAGARDARRRRSRAASFRSRRCSARRWDRGRARSSTGSSRAGSSGSPRLAQQLSVDTAGSARSRRCSAVYLEAVCVESIDDVAGTLESLAAGTVTFFAGRAGPGLGSGHDARHAALAGARAERARRAVRRHRRHRLRWPTRCACAGSCGPANP